MQTFFSPFHIASFFIYFSLRALTLSQCPSVFLSVSYLSFSSISLFSVHCIFISESQFLSLPFFQFTLPFSQFTEPFSPITQPFSPVIQPFSHFTLPFSHFNQPFSHLNLVRFSVPMKKLRKGRCRP